MFENILLISSSVLTLAGAIAVVITKDIMHACVFLLASLIGVAGLYVTLGADFVAATQFMVYVGGVVILSLFAVMLTGGKDPDAYNKKGHFLQPVMGSKKTYAFGVAAAVVFLLTIVGLMKNVLIFGKENAVAKAYEPTVEKIGSLLLTDHVLSFELSSVLLLGALIGAAIIARPKVLRIGVKKG